jgi:hypothetical protein
MRVWVVERATVSGRAFELAAICATAERATEIARRAVREHGQEVHEHQPCGAYDEGELDFITTDGLSLVAIIRSVGVQE